MIRLNIIVEGHTEEIFVKQILWNRLESKGVLTTVRRVETGHRGKKVFRGGFVKYPRIKNDIKSWLKEKRGPNEYFTTMFDLYALPNDFPGSQKAERISDPYIRVESLEKSFQKDIEDWRFFPYLQLYEYEALLLSDPSKFDGMFPDSKEGIETLETLVRGVKSPEEINDDPQTAPSKRIIKAIPEYKRSKTTAGPIVAMAIGLEKIRESCPHFNQWVEKLERLAQEEK